ncbi:MAG: hypothetical protein NVS2B12_00160 [Ktedonobacteraceae bacterium]
MRHTRKESIQAALALLLGPETDYDIRAHATRRLTRQGLAVLPLLLMTLNNYPEITTPAWPWWPPQYEHISHLLLSLIQHEALRLEDLLHDHVLKQPIGPVLWTSVLETTNLLPHVDYEDLLCAGLATPWATVRYSAAMALANRASKTFLHDTTLSMLEAHVGDDEAYSVRIAAAYALLGSGVQIGLEKLLSLTALSLPEEVRHAAVFMLAADLPTQLTLLQREQLTRCLLQLLLDPDVELAQQAALALGKIAAPTSLSTLFKLLETSTSQRQLLVLTTLEELARKRHVRYLMRQHALPTRLLPLLRVDDQELRRQAYYTLAACGGEYVAAVFGTIVLNKEHPGHAEAIESLRHLQGVLRAPMRATVVRWLLRSLSGTTEETLLTAIKTLTHLLWQARTYGYKRAWQEMSAEIIASKAALELLQQENDRVRLHAIELLVILDGYLATEPQLQTLLKKFVSTSSDSEVRAYIISAYGQMKARWAIPELIQALLDPDEQVAHMALNSLELMTTPADTLVFYVISELAHLYNGENSENTAHSTDQPASSLAHEAWILMKKWQQAEEGKDHKRLRSFS